MVGLTSSGVLPSKADYFRSLLQAPAIALPTVALFLVAIGVIALAWSMTLSGLWPLWVGTLANGISMYMLFSVAHDGAHRAISKYPIINETIGRIAIMMLLPIAPFEAVRWLHMQHHRYTNGASDPDAYAHHSRWYSMPLRFANVDIFYLYYFVRHGGNHLRRSLRPILVYSALFITLVTVLTYFGYGWQVLFLWFLASRLGLFLIVLVFSYLPHYPGTVSAQENVYRATTVRQGWEWLLTPLLVFQNYHLVHHLYPTAPFFNYLKIWHLKYAELVVHEPAVQRAFRLLPMGYTAAAVGTTPRGQV